METVYKVYILKSESLGKYYVGYTSLSLDERLAYHNYNNKGFTGKVYDWIIIHSEFFDSKTNAIKKESQIKKRGSRRYLEDFNKNK